MKLHHKNQLYTVEETCMNHDGLEDALEPVEDSTQVS